MIGNWDEAREIASSELERAARTGGLYYEPFFQLVLAELELTRHGRAQEVVEHVDTTLALGRERGDAQVVVPMLALTAWLLVRARREAAARDLLDELLASRLRDARATAIGYWTMHAALALHQLGRAGELVALGERSGSEFLAAALAVDDRRYADAAAILHAIGAGPLEAEVRILAARERDAAGDATGAEHELARARELLRGLAATARLRELDAETEATSRSGGT